MSISSQSSHLGESLARLLILLVHLTEFCCHLAHVMYQDIIKSMARSMDYQLRNVGTLQSYFGACNVHATHIWRIGERNSDSAMFISLTKRAEVDQTHANNGRVARIPRGMGG